MKVTGNDNGKHRQLHMEDYLQMVSVEQKEYAEVCGSPRITENNITNTNKQTEGLLEQILTSENLTRAYKQAYISITKSNDYHFDYISII